MSKKRVVVIGAGTLGMSAAINLVERGASVTVIDAAHVASGSSGRSVGVVGTQHVDRLAVELRAHSVRQIRHWRSLGLEFHAIGYMRLGRDERDLALFRQSLEMQRAFGLGSARIMDLADIRRLVPHMKTDGLAGALFGPEDGFLDPHAMCTLLARLVTEKGGAIRQNCRLQGAERRRGGGFDLATSTGAIACDAVVNAAGPWAGKVAEILGQSLHITPERHEAVTIKLDRPLGYVMPMVMDLVQGRGTGLNFRHDRPTELITEFHKPGAGTPADPDDYDGQIGEAAKEQLAEMLLERVPDLPGAGFGRGWAGLYPCSPDGLPLVGCVDPSEPAIVTAAGAGGYGIQLGPVIGQLAADWVLQGEPQSIPSAACLAPTKDRNRAASSVDDRASQPSGIERPGPT